MPLIIIIIKSAAFINGLWTQYGAQVPALADVLLRAVS